jgi:zinc protease
MKSDEDRKTIRRAARCAVLCVLLLAPWIRARTQDTQDTQEKQHRPQIWKNQPEQAGLQLKENEPWSFIYHQDTSSEITIVQILIKGGKGSIPVSQRGLTFLTTGLSVDMPTRSKLIRLMHLGSTIFYQVEGDFSIIQINTLSGNFEETLQIAAGVLTDPLFSAMRINNIKRYLEHRQKGEEDSPEQIMERTCLDAFFGPGGKYAGSIYGDADSRKNIKRKDVLRFYNRFFNRSNMIITVSSSLAKPEIARIIEKCFASLPRGEMNKTNESETPARGSIPGEKSFTLEKDTQQVLIAVGILLPGMSRENYAHLYMLDNLLGKGPGSKLWPLRVEKDLAYNIHTHFSQFKDAGVFTLYLKTSAAKKDEAHTALKELIAAVYKQGITQQELDSTIVRSRADFLRENETKVNRTRTLAHFEALGVGYDFIETFLSHVDQVTLEDFNGYIKQVLNPEHWIEVIIGPAPTPDQERQDRQNRQTRK